jgi:ankyrin repeat protein
MSTNSQESTRFIAALGNECIQQDEALFEIKSFLQIYSVNDNIQPEHSSLQQPPLYWVLSTILWDFDSVYSRILILLEHGAELNVLYEVNSVVSSTPLHLVMTKILECEDSNTISLGRLLVSNGADPNFQAEVCPLLCDCLELHYRSVDITVFLMEIGTNPNQVGKRGWTALMFAVEAGYTDNVDVLLRYGANPTYRSKQSRETEPCHPLYCNISAIEFACAIGRLSCLELCLKYVCKGPTKQPLLLRALVIACESGHTSIVFFLLTKLLLPEVC